MRALHLVVPLAVIASLTGCGDSSNNRANTVPPTTTTAPADAALKTTTTAVGTTATAATETAKPADPAPTNVDDDPGADACSGITAGEDLRNACENSYYDCANTTAKALAKRVSYSDASDIQGLTIAYGEDGYGSSGSEAQAAARIGCRTALEAK